MAQSDTPVESAAAVRRLCSEIQLFDLCDLERCGHRDGRYCTHPGLLSRFERIADEDDEKPGRLVYVDEDEDGDEDGGDFDTGEYDDEDDGGWDE